MTSTRVRSVAAVLVVAGLWAAAVPAEGRTLLKTICRVKGQEENTLQGLGIVVGLKGTGDGGSSLPMLRALAQAMQYLGSPTGKTGPIELKDAKNVALVLVTATVPAQGGRQGDKLDCTVSSVGSAKSLSGGRLFMTPLVGPGDPKNPRVYAIAEGPITLDNATQTTTGRIYSGCRLEEDFFNLFVKDGKMTLVLDRNFADFQVAAEVADVVNKSLVSVQSESAAPAKALDPCNIEVSIPRQYQSDPVDFVSQVLGLSIPDPQTGARVVINERAGSIVISGDAEIGPVVVTSKNIVVEAGTATNAAARFVPLDPRNESPTLKSLVEALNAVRIPTEDVIEIIKEIQRNGKLRAQLIIE
jgi:flagellar P-ring protein precursor FlgI